MSRGEAARQGQVEQPDEPGELERELERFRSTFMYRDRGFLVDEVLRLDRDAHEIEASLATDAPLPYSDLQRVQPGHPAHVAAAELVMATGSLGCLHAFFFHGCRWDEGWAGFGNRIHRADFKRLVVRGPALRMHSRETRVRSGARRVVIRFAFRFHQEGQLVYVGDQSAMFVRGLAEDGAGGD